MHSELPVGVAALVGRGRQRAKVAELIAEARVVTLTGSGGCGKTRLAVEVAGDVTARFADGACWVDLQGVGDPGMVAAAVGGAVGVRERPGQALVDTLAERLCAQHLLVVLDNCEHLIEACAQLVAGLVSACPRLHVLATSRVPLAVAGEASFEVGPLPVPGPDAGSPGTVAASDAGRLFEVRARQVAADFRIDEGNAVVVAEICRRLDGIPLAIELAAARVRVLAPAQIAAGLSDRFGLLTGGVRGAPARQRTLEASLDWSYDLLEEAQRLVLARLSVFAGSFELDAAEAVVVGEGIDLDDVLDLVTALVEQSMVEVVGRHGRARYRLLETIRVYARQRLSELDDPARVRDRHLAFHVGLAGRAQTGLAGGEPEPWMARLTADLDDLRAAMDRAAASGDLGSLVDLIEPIVRFWFEHGLSTEVHRRLHDAADAPGTPDHERVRGLLAAVGLILAARWEPATAYRLASRAVDAGRAADAGGALATALGLRAWMGAWSGLSPSDQSDADVEEALHLVERGEDAATHAYVLIMAAGTLLVGRTNDAGCDLLEQAVEVCETDQLGFQLPSVHAALGLWSVWSGELEQARRHARRGIEFARQIGRPGWEAIGLTGLAAADVLQGDHGQAQARLSKAQSVLRAQALKESQYGVWLGPWLALSAYACGDLNTARTSAEEIVRVSRENGSRWDEANGEWLLGMLAQDQGRHDDARAHLQASHGLSVDPRMPLPLGRSLLGLAQLAEQDDDLETAWELAHDALQVLADYGDRIGAARVLETIADLAAALGEPERSLRLLAALQRFHRETGIARFPGQAERFERAHATARAVLDDADATAYLDAGGELSLADAIAYVRRGRGERQRPQIGWGSLTPVERDLVRLVAAGHTNAEIGERLFLSVNTVKKYLTRIYTKVDADGRAELAAEVARRELESTPGR
jgi:predicted ATPase/DNA-binding CsgD family transcriptional regulator